MKTVALLISIVGLGLGTTSEQSPGPGAQASANTAMSLCGRRPGPCALPRDSAAQSAQQPGARAQATSGGAQNGKRLYVSYGCYQCHGREGQGAVSGPRLTPRTTPLASLVRYVRQPTGAMPPYTTKVVPDSDLADIDAFLRAIPPAPPAKSIPLLNR